MINTSQIKSVVIDSLLAVAGLGLCLLILLPSGCGNQQMAAVLDGVEACMQSRPDSALAVLRTMDTSSLDSRRLQARYALLHAMALDKNWIDTTDVGVVMPAVRYYDRRRPVANRAKPYYYLGRIQYNGGHYDEAVISFTRAKEYARKMDDDRFKALNSIALANTYNSTSAYEEALLALKDAELFGERCQDSMLLYTILFDKAQYLINLKHFQEADDLFKDLVQEGNPFVKRFPGVLSSYAMFLVTPPNQEFCEARSLFEKAIQMTGSLESAQYWGMYAYCLANTGDIIKAENILSRLEKGKKTQHLSTSYIQSLVSAVNEDYKSAYFYLQKTHDFLNQEAQERLRQSAVKAQRDYYLLQKESLQRENNLRKWIMMLLILFVGAATISILSLVRRFREKVQQQNRALMETAQDIMALRRANEILSSDKEKAFARQVSLRQEYFLLNQESYKELSDLCNTYYKNDGQTSESSAVCGEVRGLMKRLGIGADRYSILEQRVNETFDHVMDHFRKEHPNHREQFFQATCYLFAGFKIRTIALLLHLGEQDIYRLKWRLKKEVEKAETPHQKDFLTLLKGSS